MSYSDTQFQRALLKTLDKIADELHKSNKITENAIKYTEKYVEMTKESKEPNETDIAVNVGVLSKDDLVRSLHRKLGCE